MRSPHPTPDRDAAVDPQIRSPRAFGQLSERCIGELRPSPGQVGVIAGLDVSELLELALLLVAVGALSGFLAGLFGIGGGAILVPVFYECFRLAGVPLEVRMPLCIGTSLAIIIPTSIRRFAPIPAARSTWRPQEMVAAGLTGVIAGSVTARYAPDGCSRCVRVVAWSAAARLMLGARPGGWARRFRRGR